MFQRIQERNRRFLVIFHNGSTEEIDLAIFGFLLFGYSTNKVLWTFQGRLRLQPRMKVVKIVEATAKTDVFLSASSQHQEDPGKFWSFLVHQEATEVATSLADNNTGAAGRGIVDQPSQIVECFLYMLKLRCLRYHFNMVGDYDYDMATHRCNYWMCDAIIRQEGQGEATEGGDASWQAADALSFAMPLPFDVDDHPYVTPSHLVAWSNDNRTTSQQQEAPFPSPLYWHLPVPASAIPNADMFQYFDNKLSVLKLYGRTFSLSSPPFINCHNLKFLWLHHCQLQDTTGTDTSRGEEEEEAKIRQCFQNMWVLDVRYTRCDGILSSRLLDFMTQLRELNVIGAQHWDIGQLQGRLPNIRKLRVTKSTVGCTSCSETNLLLGMNKMELLDFSGNRTIQEGVVATNLSGISTSSNQLETVVIIDGCVGIQNFSFRGCAKLKNLLLSGLFEHLRILDLSGTIVKTLDLSAMIARSLDELFLDDCHKLCAIRLPPEGKRKRSLNKLHIGTTQSASTSRIGEEKIKACSTTATGPSSSWPMVLVNGAQPRSEFHWYISIKDTRLLRSFVPSFEKYFENNRVHLEISSPSCPTVNVDGTESEGIKKNVGEEPPVLRNRRQLQPQYNDIASMYYADVATSIVEEDLVQGGDSNDDDAPTITRTRPCPPPDERMDPSSCYLYTQDKQMKKKAMMDSGAMATIPSNICDRAWILHVHDSLYNTSIPGPSQWDPLHWCRVERCPRLDFIFTTPQLGDGSSVRMCWYLRTFWASQLPRTRFMWDTSKLPLSQIHGQSFEEVKLLHLDFCPRLIHVLPFSSSVIVRRYLETLEIVWCGDLRVIFPLLDTNNESHQNQQQKPPGAIITTVKFPNLKHIHLHELPKLESICGLGRMYAPELETIKIRGCWSLRHLPAVSSDRSTNKVECDCEKEWWDRLEWDGLDGKHHPSLYRPVHSRYYKKKFLRGSVLI